MKRKSGGEVPIGNTVSGLDGQIPALRKAAPQTEHHFTRADQVDQLVNASEADADMGFVARTMALCSLPRSNPGDRKEYVRRNGPYILGMTAGLHNKLPYGNLPRLILAWLCTEVVKTGRREIILGRSLADFMRSLGVYSSAGGVKIRLRNQMDRLFNAHVSLIYEDKRGKATMNSQIADSTVFWWNLKRPKESTLWESKIELSEKFFNEIINHPVPIEMNTLKALKRSSLGLDLYLWLTYRVFTLRTPLALPWKQVYRQFGVNPAKASDNVTVQAFRRKGLRELKKIKMAWPELNYSTARGVLILWPSRMLIPPRQP